jgi:hypothetical protein
MISRLIGSDDSETDTSGAKAHIVFDSDLARLKPCPFERCVPFENVKGEGRVVLMLAGCSASTVVSGFQPLSSC